MTEKIEFKIKDGEMEERFLTYTKDLDAFIDELLKKRNIDPENALLIFGLDGGQGKFLVTLIIADSTKNYKCDKYKQQDFTSYYFQLKLRISLKIHIIYL